MVPSSSNTSPPRSESAGETSASNVAPPRSKRVLITGVGRFWGSNLARALEKDHSLDFLCGIDTREPEGEFGRTEVVRGDIRNAAIARLIEVTRVDTVIHTQIFGADRPGESSRLLHDMNVIGTMNLLAACAASPHVRKVIIRSSTAVYGSSPKAPAFCNESHDIARRLRGHYARDIAEVEAYARDYAARSTHAAVTILRFANTIGEHVDTALTRYLTTSVAPTWAGYNPPLQFIDAEDAVAALAHAMRVWKPGVFNVAGPGTITLWRYLRLAGRIPAPILPPGAAKIADLLAHSSQLYAAMRYRDLLRFGCGADTTRMREELGFMPEYTTVEAAERFAAFVRVRRYHALDDEPMFDRELVDYVQRKVSQMPAFGQSFGADMLSRLGGLDDTARKRGQGRSSRKGADDV